MNFQLEEQYFILCVQQLCIPKTIEMTKEKFEGKIRIYVRKHEIFPLKDGKFDNFYKMWYMTE